MGVAVEEDKNPAGEEGKNPAEEVDRNPAGQISYSASTLDGQDLQQLGGAEKTQEPVDADEPAREGGGAKINKGQVLLSKAEKTHSSVDAEEPLQPSRNELAPERLHNTVRTAEARQYWSAYASVPEDVCLPDGWHLNPNRVPVPPPPRGLERLQEIHRRRVDLPPELHADPFYGVNSLVWDQIFETEHEIRRHSFVTTSPPASFFDSDDECDSDDPDAAKTDDDLYVRQPGDVGYIPPQADVPMEDAATN